MIERPMIPPPWVLAIDPGQHYLAWALLSRGEVVKAGVVEANKGVAARNTLPRGTRARLLATQITSAVVDDLTGEDLHIVVEGQQTREGEGKRGDQQILVEMAFNSGFVAGMLALRLGAAVSESVSPTDWKGSIKKDVMLRRISGILEATGERKNMARYNKDTKDAAGIGLWYVRRM